MLNVVNQGLSIRGPSYTQSIRVAQTEYLENTIANEYISNKTKTVIHRLKT